MGFWLIIILIYFLLVVGLTFLAFWLPKRKGRKKLGIRLAIATFLITTSPITSFALEDYWFFKSDVTRTLENHNFILEDDFKILSHEITGLMDYYEQFTIELTEKDKERLIEQINNAENYQNLMTEYPYGLISGLPRYSNDSTEEYTWNFRTTTEYGYQFYKPKPQGNAPTYVLIMISKNGTTLKYELIYD